MAKAQKPSAGHGRQVKQDKILAALRAGNTRKASYNYAGVDERTFYDWLKTPGFSQAVSLAESAPEVVCATTLIKQAQNGSVRAAVEWLKRRRSADWKEITQVNVRDLTNEQLLWLVERGEGRIDSAGDTAAVEGRLDESLPLSE